MVNLAVTNVDERDERKVFFFVLGCAGVSTPLLVLQGRGSKVHQRVQCEEWERGKERKGWWNVWSAALLCVSSVFKNCADYAAQVVVKEKIVDRGTQTSLDVYTTTALVSSVSWNPSVVRHCFISSTPKTRRHADLK